MARSSRGWNPDNNGQRRNANTFSVSLSDAQADRLEKLSIQRQRRIPDLLRDLIDGATVDYVTAADGSPSKNAEASVDGSGEAKGNDPLTGEPKVPAGKHS